MFTESISSAPNSRIREGTVSQRSRIPALKHQSVPEAPISAPSSDVAAQAPQPQAPVLVFMGLAPYSLNPLCPRALNRPNKTRRCKSRVNNKHVGPDMSNLGRRRVPSPCETQGQSTVDEKCLPPVATLLFTLTEDGKLRRCGVGNLS